MSSRRLTSAWKLLVSALVSGAVSWVIGRVWVLRGPPQDIGVRPRGRNLWPVVVRRLAGPAPGAATLSRGKASRECGRATGRAVGRLGLVSGRVAHAAAPALDRPVDLRGLGLLRP